MFLHGYFLPALGAEGVVLIGGITGQERKPYSFSQKQPTPAQTAQPGAFCQPLLCQLPCPVRLLSLLGAPCSGWVFELSHLPGSGSLSHRQRGEGCAVPLCHQPVAQWHLLLSLLLMLAFREPRWSSSCSACFFMGVSSFRVFQRVKTTWMKTWKTTGQ